MWRVSPSGSPFPLGKLESFDARRRQCDFAGTRGNVSRSLTPIAGLASPRIRRKKKRIGSRRVRLTMSFFFEGSLGKDDRSGTWNMVRERFPRRSGRASARGERASACERARVSFSAVLNHRVNLDRGKSDDVRVPLIMRHTRRLRRQARVFPHNRLGTFVKRQRLRLSVLSSENSWSGQWPDQRNNFKMQILYLVPVLEYLLRRQKHVVLKIERFLRHTRACGGKSQCRHRKGHALTPKIFGQNELLNFIIGKVGLF